MLGLGGDIVHNSFAGAGPVPIEGLLGLTSDDNPTTEHMVVNLTVDDSQNIGVLTNDIENLSIGAKIGGQFSLKVDRINSGGSVFATSTFDVYGYKYTNSVAQLSYIVFSEVDSPSGLASSTFLSEGSSLIDWDAKNVTVSGQSNLYNITLTVSGSGYLDTSIQQINVTHYTD